VGDISTQGMGGHEADLTDRGIEEEGAAARELWEFSRSHGQQDQFQSYDPSRFESV
jgi:hypothetical protein